jgi:hypothetical protein
MQACPVVISIGTLVWSAVVGFLQGESFCRIPGGAGLPSLTQSVGRPRTFPTDPFTHLSDLPFRQNTLVSKPGGSQVLVARAVTAFHFKLWLPSLRRHE